MAGILWGPPKAGKTTFLMSAPGKKLIVNLDPDGYQSVAGRDDFSLLDVSQENSDVVVRFCRDKLGTLIQQTDELEAGDTVIFDSMSSYAHNALEDAIKKGVGSGPKFTPSLETPGLAAYGARKENTVTTALNLLKATARKGCHCFFTAHLDEPTRNKEGDYLYETMSLSGKTINGITLAMSEIWYMYENNGKRFLDIRPCRGKQPMGTRIFTTTGLPEFELKYDPSKNNSQPHSMTTWFNAWKDGGGQKLPLPK